MIHRRHHAPTLRGVRSEWLGQFWRVWGGKFWRAPKHKPKFTPTSSLSCISTLTDHGFIVQSRLNPSQACSVRQFPLFQRFGVVQQSFQFCPQPVPIPIRFRGTEVQATLAALYKFLIPQSQKRADVSFANDSRKISMKRRYVLVVPNGLVQLVLRNTRRPLHSMQYQPPPVVSPSIVRPTFQASLKHLLASSRCDHAVASKETPTLRSEGHRSRHWRIN